MPIEDCRGNICDRQIDELFGFHGNVGGHVKQTIGLVRSRSAIGDGAVGKQTKILAFSDASERLITLAELRALYQTMEVR